MTNYTPVVMQFKCTQTTRTIYEIHIKELKDTITALDNDKDTLREAEMELSDLLAQVKNRQYRCIKGA